MEEKTETKTKNEAEAEKKAKARRDILLGVIFSALIVGLIAMMFMIENYGQSTMPGATNRIHDSADN